VTVRRLDLRENGDAVEVPLSAAEGMALTGTRVVQATPVPNSTLWSVKPLSWVGTVRLGGVEVSVAPKIPVARLVELLQFSARGATWHGEDVEVLQLGELVVAVAEVFERAAARGLARGLLQGYRSRDETSVVVRGRIREADQLRRRYGAPLPVEVRYDDFTVDIPENRLLRAATRRARGLPGLPGDLRKRLGRLDLLLDEVSPVDGLPEPWTPTRLTTRLHPALALAELLLRGSGFDQGVGDLQVAGFVVNMAVVFEDVVCSVLGEQLSASSGTTQRQDPWFLDRRGAVRMLPDLVWYPDGVAPGAVVDAKYKAERPGGFPDADLYQMLAYCTALEVPVGHLVYAQGNEEGARHDVVGSRVAIRAHTVDLSRPVADMRRQLAAIAAEVASTSS